MKKSSNEDIYQEIDVPLDTDIEDLEVSDFYAQRFLEYGSHTVLSRAIPDLVDGLLPVRRKILYTFHRAKADKPKKATYFIGNCMSTVYVQGDASLYGSMVSMAQWFKMLNPLIKPTGAVGSPHNATPAAARYLELSLDDFAKKTLFRDYDESIVPMKDNYDLTMKEPITLPATFPMLFNIGVTGIGSGFVSEIPPHKVDDICKLTIDIIKNPEKSVSDLVKGWFYPDFPLGANIINAADLPKIYENGQGVIKMQATINEGIYKGKPVLIVEDLPYKVSTENVLEQIRDLCKGEKNKKGILEDYLSDMIDVSDKANPVRIILIPKRNTNLVTIKNILYQHTSLATSIKYICNVLDGKKLMINANIKDVLTRWIENRIDFIKKQIRQEITKNSRQLVINKALIKAQANIEEIVKEIKNSKNRDSVIEYLVKTLEISRTEASYIADLKLYRLSNMETQELADEIARLEVEIEKGIVTVKNHAEIVNILVKDLEEIATKYKSNRKTKALNIDSISDERDLVESKNFIFAISEDGMIYSKEENAIKTTSSRNTVGTNFIDSRYKRYPKFIANVNTHDDVLLITESGMLHKVKALSFFVNHVHLSAINSNLLNDKIVSAIPIYKDSDWNDFELFIATKKSLCKRISLGECTTTRRNGLIIINLGEGDKVVNALLASKDYCEANITLITNKGRIQVNRFDAVALMKRTTMGNARIKLKNDEYVTDIDLSLTESSILMVTKNGIGKYVDLSTIPERGYSANKGTAFVGIKLKDNDELLHCRSFRNDMINELEVSIITNGNKISKFDLSNISGQTRNSMGVSIVKLDTNQQVSLISLSLKE